MSRRDPAVFIGLAVVTLSAAVSSFGALYGVAVFAGWSKQMALTFPATIDATAMVATRIWLAASTPTEAARRYARSVAVGAVLVSLAGNGAYHLTAAHVIHPGVALVIATGTVPPLALAVVAHLAVLRGAALDSVGVPEPAVPTASGLGTPNTPEVSATATTAAPQRPALPNRTRVPISADTPSWGALLATAQQVNAASVAETGRPAGISRLRAELRVGQAKAQQLRDHLKALPAADHTRLPVERVNGVPVAAG